MNKLKIYIDTSVIGGCFDDEFSYYSNQLFAFNINNTYIYFLMANALVDGQILAG